MCWIFYLHSNDSLKSQRENCCHHRFWLALLDCWLQNIPKIMDSNLMLSKNQQIGWCGTLNKEQSGNKWLSIIQSTHVPSLIFLGQSKHNLSSLWWMFDYLNNYARHHDLLKHIKIKQLRSCWVKRMEKKLIQNLL